MLVKLDELDRSGRLRAGATTGAADAERMKTNPNPSTPGGCTCIGRRIFSWLEPRTHNRCTWAFAASASVGAFGVYLLLAASIGLVALAGAGGVWKCCGINCGTGSSASSIRSSGMILWVHHRTLAATVSKGHGVGVRSSTYLFFTSSKRLTLAGAGLRGGSAAVNARHGADHEASWH